jgi:TRAP-type mannitol/chloroaromatic compound transport system permease small subunit
MNALLSFSRAIDAMNRFIGRWTSWLILVTVIISAGNAIMRKLFNMSSNAWLEAQWYLFGTVFLFCAAWTLLDNEHIRIDVLSSRFSQRARNIVELVGHGLFLLPFTILMLVDTLPFAVTSLRINEQSNNAGGLPVWPAKFILLIGFGLLFLQGISELIKRIAIMRGELEDQTGGGHLEALEAEAKRLLEQAKADGLAAHLPT